MSAHGVATDFKRESLGILLFLSVYIQADIIKICIKYRLIPQKYNKNNNNMEYGGGYLWLWGVWFCGVCGGGVGV